MAQNKRFTMTAALTTTLTTNILNPAVTSMAGPVGLTIGQPYFLVNQIRIINKTASAATFSLYRGATGANAAGTEVGGTALSVAANSSLVVFAGYMRLDSADFLVGGSGTTLSLVIQIDGEVGISG